MQNFIYTLPQAWMDDKNVALHWKLYSIINGFWLNAQPVFASNKWFAEKLGCSERNVRLCLEQLENLKLVIREGNSQKRKILPAGKVIVEDEGGSPDSGRKPSFRKGGSPASAREEAQLPHISISNSDKINNTIASETDAQVHEEISSERIDDDGNPIKPKKPKKVSRYLAPFDFLAEKKKLEESAFRPNNIIAFYFDERKWTCDNYAVWMASCNRHMPAAKRLVGFKDSDLVRGARLAAEKTPEWTLETILKVLTK